MKNIMEKILIVLLALCFMPFSYGRDCVRAIEDLTQEIKERLGQRKVLRLDHKEFLFPEYADGQFAFFIELNRMSSLVKSLEKSVVASELSPQRKALFLQRVTAQSKEAAWEEILWTLPETPPLLLAGIDVRVPTRGEIDMFLGKTEEVKSAGNEYIKAIAKSASKEDLGRAKVRYFEKISVLLSSFFDPSLPEVKEIYEDVFREIFLPWTQVKEKEKILDNETRMYLRKVCSDYVARIREIDSPLKDYIYLRLYEKMREERQ